MAAKDELRGGTGTADDELVDRLAELRVSRLLSVGSPFALAVDRVAHLAQASVPGVDEASMTLVEDGEPRTVASTGEVAERLDRRQYGSGTGPCLEAARTGLTVQVPDMAADDRFPDFAQEALRAGVVRSLSVAVPLPGRSVGGLNLYARSSRAFGRSTVAVARAFAAHAALTLAHAALHARADEQVHQLEEAMASRAVIEQAKGMVMAARGCDADEAYAELRRLGSASGQKVRVVAEALVAARGRTL